ncbi:MAG: peptidylprolyl isomerase [Bacteroidetes bacterium]|nr:peptidylprolyl isomerase [Bacteroidota bacterium]
MRSVIITLFTLGFLSLNLNAQQAKPLFTYGSDTVYTDEFVRVFLKNNKLEEQNDSSIRAYLNLYINFKLKVAEAESLKLDENPAFQQELAGYREQLSRSYMTDTSLTSKLVDEAYDRMKSEVRASHILILVGPNALPKDTMRAWERISDLRKKAVGGYNFDTLAYYNSEDPSAKTNYGDLGYFTAFEMIYPFETMAFQTKPGDISPIFRTDFGYHILKVADKRPNRGEVRVAHLMIRLNPNAKEEEILTAKRKADSLYSLLNQGADWNKTVRTYSDDASSSGNGGELNWIRSNSPVAEPFREAAFGLDSVGEISKPVLTEYGWHIIKLLEKKPLPPKSELADRLKMQVNREPERVRMSQEALVKKFKASNGFEENTKNVKSLYLPIDSSIIRGTFKANMVKEPETILFTIGTRSVTNTAFYQYAEQYQTPQNTSIQSAVANLYKGFVAKEVLQYEKDNLEAFFPDFKNLMEEYHDGILLFNLTQQKVWDKAVEDTVGLKNFYEAHKNEYQWKDRLQATIYECNNKKTYKLTRKLLHKHLENVDISQQVNEKNPLSLVIKHSKFEKGENAQVDQIEWKKGTHTVKTEDGKYYIIVVSEVIPAGPKAFNEVKGLMTGKYQDELERQWIEELKAKYPVVVNTEVLKQISPK